MERIAVIVPVYNVEPYLRRCIDSITQQTYSNLEILLIDDGSTDGSSAICDEYADRDERISVIHQENKGLGEARNAGIDSAESDYYVFVDSDDEIEPIMLEALWYVMQKTDADIAQCGLKEVFEEETAHRVHNDKPFNPDELGEIHVLTGRESIKRLSNRKMYDWHTALQCNKLFRKEIFDNIRYSAGLYHEDEWVIHRELLAAKLFAYVDVPLYIYYRRSDSITGRKSLKLEYDAASAILDRIKFFYDQEEPFEYYTLSMFLSHSCMTKEKVRMDDIEEWKQEMKELFKEGTRFYIDNIEKQSLNTLLKDKQLSKIEKSFAVALWTFRYARLRANMAYNKLMSGVINVSTRQSK